MRLANAALPLYHVTSDLNYVIEPPGGSRGDFGTMYYGRYVITIHAAPSSSLTMTSKKEKPLHSLIAGTTAGAIEAYVDSLVESALAQRV